MLDLEKALLDPSSQFKKPNDVLQCKEISRQDKIKILRRWVYDLNEIAVAEEENMRGETDVGEIIDEIIAAMHVLHAEVDTDHTPPTKQGGLPMEGDNRDDD